MNSFSIKSSTIRLGIYISSVIIATILVFQLVWLNSVYHSEQKQFKTSVVKAIRGLYEDLDIAMYNYTPLNDLIESPEPNLYIARITPPFVPDTLANYLRYELEDFDVFTDCYLGVYSKDDQKYIYNHVLLFGKDDPTKKWAAPTVHPSYDHISLYFPNRRQYILSQMNFWIISSAVLLVVLLLFGASLYYFYKQKFLNETQKDFIHNFTHEFKTPVSVIKLAADVLKNPSIAQKPEKLSTYAGIVEYQSEYLQKQIEKLLQFAYTESNELHLSREKVNLHELIRESIQNLNPLIVEKNVTLHLRLDAENPELTADKNYLVIVITNLVDNSIKYSRSPEITLTTKNTDHGIEFSVEDNGIGIEKHQLNKIFKKFFRARNGETYAAKGFGIGLSFVKRIVTAHNGKIRVSSAPGQGSVFTIELPNKL